MTFEELIHLLIERKALIVHCSRPGKGDVGADGLLFPEDLRNAIKICGEEHRELSCSLIWPGHVKTLGAVGIILKPRAIDSITSISPHDSGTSPDEDGRRQGMGVPFSAQAVDDTFANSKDYNEWTVTDADTIGIFLNLYEPLEIAREIPITDMPGYDPAMGDMGSIIGPVRITIREVMAAFPNLPLFGFAGTEIVEIGIDAASLYS
ncbi:hypothetical protein NXC12_PE00121 (plasmid) [Rhizobium etli]|uniref:Uncharacterized protein n=1 Tax=Rhizobium etli TaxID=29449 RepID=A0AAN1ENH5_RHIET|nr:hypothetical protein [Rhizobium etli]ARQ13723.1 hypothetical protein NXC12_PE00121 [Rhizobium etli]